MMNGANCIMRQIGVAARGLLGEPHSRSNHRAAKSHSRAIVRSTPPQEALVSALPCHEAEHGNEREGHLNSVRSEQAR